jgi:hypothetical protein
MDCVVVVVASPTSGGEVGEADTKEEEAHADKITIDIIEKNRDGK